MQEEAGRNLEGANLKGQNLENRYFEAANLKNANLDSTNLAGANLEWAELQYANLSNANLKNASLVGAHLGNANLEKAKGLAKEQILSAWWGTDESGNGGHPSLPHNLMEDEDIKEWCSMAHYEWKDGEYIDHKYGMWCGR